MASYGTCRTRGSAADGHVDEDAVLAGEMPVVAPRTWAWVRKICRRETTFEKIRIDMPARLVRSMVALVFTLKSFTISVADMPLTSMVHASSRFFQEVAGGPPLGEGVALAP